MLLFLFAAPVFAGEYDITLRVEDRRGRTVLEQRRAIADSVPRAIPFIWKREAASALITTRGDMVCFWLVDQAGAPLQILGTGGCTTLGDTSEATTTIQAPEGQAELQIRARARSSLDDEGQVVPFTPPPEAR